MSQEDSSKRRIRLDFEHTTDLWTSDKIGHIIHVLQQSFDSNVQMADVEWEYYVKDSIDHVPRTYPEKPRMPSPDASNSNRTPSCSLSTSRERPLVWEMPSSGIASLNPYFVHDEKLTTTDVPSGMVEVEAKAFGLNFREVKVQLG